jgi:hypothetical protein
MILPFYFSCTVGMTDVLHYTQFLLVEIGSHELFSWAVFELGSSWSLAPEKLRLTGVSHCTCPST